MKRKISSRTANHQWQQDYTVTSTIFRIEVDGCGHYLGLILKATSNYSPGKRTSRMHALRTKYKETVGQIGISILNVSSRDLGFSFFRDKLNLWLSLPDRSSWHLKALVSYFLYIGFEWLYVVSLFSTYIFFVLMH